MGMSIRSNRRLRNNTAVHHKYYAHKTEAQLRKTVASLHERINFKTEQQLKEEERMDKMQADGEDAGSEEESDKAAAATVSKAVTTMYGTIVPKHTPESKDVARSEEYISAYSIKPKRVKGKKVALTQAQLLKAALTHNAGRTGYKSSGGKKFLSMKK